MSNTKKTKSVGDKLAGAQRAQDRMMIYLPGPAKAEWNRLREEYEQVKARRSDMLTPDPREKTIARKLLAIEEQMREDGIEVLVQALRRQRTPSTPVDETTWNELIAKHPPRKGKDGKPAPEDSLGVNLETFPEALIRASILEPEFTAEQVDQLLYEVMTDAQYDGLFQMCWRLNRAPVDVPFSSAASRTLASAAVSKRQSGSASATSGSAAGSQEK